MIDFTVAGYLNAIRPRIPESLIGDESFARILKIGGRLPGMSTSLFGFECVLGDQKPAADFLTCVAREEVDDCYFAGCKILAGRSSELHFPHHFFDHQPWQSVQQFCQQWDDQVIPLKDRVANIWLEFDVDEINVDVPVPCVFFGIVGSEDPRATRRQQLTFALDALSLLLATAINKKMVACIERCFECLPRNAWIFQVGAMLARNCEAVRLCVRDIQPESVTSYLTKVGWAGPIGEIEELLGELEGIVHRIDLDIDVGESIFPKVGFECYLQQGSQTKQQLERFTEYLVQRNLSTDAKADALIDYCHGLSHEHQNPSQWPECLRHVSSLLGANALSVLLRYLHHIKIVHCESQPLKAKAYLAVEHKWIDKSVLKRCQESATVDRNSVNSG